MTDAATATLMADPSDNNLIIDRFFRGLNKGPSGYWLNPADDLDWPPEVRSIYKSMNRFFRDKKWHNGGPIPNELLYTKKNFHLVNNLSLIDAIDFAYEAIAKCRNLAKTAYRKNVDIVITMKVINQCIERGVQGDHRGGILILYLDLCERVVLL